MLLIMNTRCAFTNVASFRAFCALADIDPDDGRQWNKHSSTRAVGELYPFRTDTLYDYIWLSRSKDIVFESSMNPLIEGHCHYCGLTGVADKAIALFNFVHDNFVIGRDMPDSEIGVYWEELEWGRGYM